MYMRTCTNSIYVLTDTHTLIYIPPTMTTSAYVRIPFVSNNTLFHLCQLDRQMCYFNLDF